VEDSFEFIMTSRNAGTLPCPADAWNTGLDHPAVPSYCERAFTTGGGVSREKLHTEVRRDQLTDATLAVVADRGLRGLSLAAVARRVGLTPSAIYRHFPSKDALLDAVLERLRERLHGAIAAARAETDDPVEALHRLLQRHLRLVRHDRALPRIVLSDDYHLGHPERRRRLLGVFSGYLDGVADILRQGQRLGSIRSDVNARSLAILFLGLIQPAGVLWTLSDGRFDVTGQARSAWPVFEHAIRAPVMPAARAVRAPRSRRTVS
jgi:AcrR family transcriptional regulator